MFCKHEPPALLVKLEDVKAENMQKCLHPRKSAKKKVKLIRRHQGQIANTTASNEGLGKLGAAPEMLSGLNEPFHCFEPR